MSRARLSLEANARAHVKHIAPLPTDRLLQLSAPVHERVMHASTTVRSAVKATSLPNASTDAALRRLTSAQRPVLKATARRAGIALPPSAGVRIDTTRRLATGALAVDPSGFVPSGILGIAGLECCRVARRGRCARRLERCWNSGHARVGSGATAPRRDGDATHRAASDNHAARRHSNASASSWTQT